MVAAASSTSAMPARFCSASAACGLAFGTSSPASAASESTASMNDAPVDFITKVMASPCSPQPKQWK